MSIPNLKQFGRSFRNIWLSYRKGYGTLYVWCHANVRYQNVVFNLKITVEQSVENMKLITLIIWKIYCVLFGSIF